MQNDLVHRVSMLGMQVVSSVFRQDTIAVRHTLQCLRATGGMPFMSKILSHWYRLVMSSDAQKVSRVAAIDSLIAGMTQDDCADAC